MTGQGDDRVAVIESLLPDDAVFLQLRREGHLWRPGRSGYVNEGDVFGAGLYDATAETYFANGQSDHSVTVSVIEMLERIGIEDGTIAALLVDEIIRLRDRLASAGC